MNYHQRQQYVMLSEIAQNRGYKVVSKYTNRNEAMIFRCFNDHCLTASSVEFKNGEGCEKCREEEKQKLYTKLSTKLSDKKYILHDAHVINNICYIIIKCSESHTFTCTPYDFVYKNISCNICDNNVPCIKNFFDKLKEKNAVQMNNINNNLTLTTRITMRCIEGHLFVRSPKQ